MKCDPTLVSEANRLPAGKARLAISVTLCTLYCWLWFVRPVPWCPQPLRRPIQGARTWLLGLIETAHGGLGIGQITSEVSWAIYFVLTAGFIPWVVFALVGRGRPHDIGLRPPNRIGWRTVFVGYLIALPLQVWMVRSATFASYYLPRLERAGATAFVLYYLAVMLVEHFFFHGILLAACGPGGRWPTPAPVLAEADGTWRRLLQWIGLSQPVHGARGIRWLTRWVGLPDGCVPAILVSGLLFAAVHLGKDSRELMLSLPGGMALGYVSYRTNSWLVPFLLHGLTAGTACALMLLMD